MRPTTAIFPAEVREQYMPTIRFDLTISDAGADKLVEQLKRAAYYREMEMENPELRVRLRTGRYKDV